MKIEESEGTKLAKVLWYYNLTPDSTIGKQKIVCPFHDDVNPSLVVNFDDGSWFCFGCNESGDALKFVTLIERTRGKCTDLEACKKFIRILKSDKCSNVYVKPSVAKRQKSNRYMYELAYDYYHGLRSEDWNSPVSLEANQAAAYMEARGFTTDVLNVAKAKVSYNSSYTLIFPMLDNGKFKGWVSRTMLPEVEKKRKYLYNKGFSRATTLVGNYGTKDYVFVVEGYMDRLKFLQFGIDNVVATLGWKMSLQQIEKLKKNGVVKVISALDNDTCGKRGTEYLKKHFEVTKFAYLKGVKDPGEMTERSFDKMLKKTMERFEERKRGQA